LTLFIEKKQLVVPGELLGEGDYLAGTNTYKENRRVYASRIGLAIPVDNRLEVVPLKGCYIPCVGDIVVGRVVDVGIPGWSVDIRSPYEALLPASEVLDRRSPFSRMDLTKIFDVGDLVMATVMAFDRTRDPLLTTRDHGLGKVTSGLVVEISPMKIPRLIGKKGSMISMLKRETGCRIFVGQNGIVLVSGKSPMNERVAISAIDIVDREAHTEGLTDRLKETIRKLMEGGAAV